MIATTRVLWTHPLRWLIANPTPATVMGLSLIAAGLQVLVITRPNMLLSGGTYDTALYLGSAIKFVHGVMPYRDFALLQPPGLVLALTPYALLSLAVGSRGALMVLTACTPVLAAANVALVGRLVSPRGWRAALAACGLMAVYPATYEALLDGMLEPLMVLFCLIGALLVFDRGGWSHRWRLAAGGVAFGFATSILVAAVLPASVVALLSIGQLRRRFLPFVGGGIAGVLIPVIPFLAVGPGPFLHDTIITQLASAQGAVRSPAYDVFMYLAFRPGAGATPHRLAFSSAAVAVLVGVVLVGFIATRHRLMPVEWFAIGSALTLGAAQFAIAIYYEHFPAMLIPYPAMLLGFAVGRISPRWAPRLIPSLVALGVAALVITQSAGFATDAAVDYGPSVDAIIPPNGCSSGLTVIPYDATEQMLVQADRIWSSFPGCTALNDPVAQQLVDVHWGVDAPADFLRSLTHTNYLVTDMPLSSPSWVNPPFPALVAYIHDDFRPHQSGPLTIYVRNGFPVA